MIKINGLLIRLDYSEHATYSEILVVQFLFQDFLCVNNNYL